MADKTEFSGNGVVLAEPNSLPDVNNMESIEIFFDSRTERAIGVGLLRTRIPRKSVYEHSAVGVDESHGGGPSGEVLLDLLNNFVHELCSYLKSNDAAELPAP